MRQAIPKKKREAISVPIVSTPVEAIEGETLPFSSAPLSLTPFASTPLASTPLASALIPADSADFDIPDFAATSSSAQTPPPTIASRAAINLSLPDTASRNAGDLPILSSTNEFVPGGIFPTRSFEPDTINNFSQCKLNNSSKANEAVTEAIGTLYLVAVPIGCAEDISLRALRILRTASQIICENIHVSRKLIEQWGIDNSLLHYASNRENKQNQDWLTSLQSGNDVAFICDAGLPGIADPGQSLVRIALQHNINVTALPGPTAVLAALVASGLPTNRFLFDGFPPRTTSERQVFFQRFAQEERTIVLFESARYLRSTLKALAQWLEPSRPIAIANRLTRPDETWVRGSLLEIIAHFHRVRPAGEYTLVLGGCKLIVRTVD